MADKKELSFTISAKDAATAEVKRILGALTELTGGFVNFGAVLKGIPALLASVSVGVLIKDMFDLAQQADKAMRTIAAVVPTGVAGLKQLGDEIEDVAKRSGRSLEEVRGAAVQIAKLGASGPQEIAERMKAAALFADATGGDLTSTVSGLVEVMRIFQMSGAQAEQMLAKIASASKGKVGAAEVLDAFTVAAPAIRKMGLDADTATAAIARLIEMGFSSRALRKYLNDATPEGLREMASQAVIAKDALGELNKSAEEVRAGSDRAYVAVKDRFSSALERMGSYVLPIATAALKGFADVLDGLSDGSVVRMLVDPDAWLKDGRGKSTARDTPGEGPVPAGTSVGKVIKPPLTQSELDKAVEAKKKLAEVRTEMEKLGITTAAATPKYIQFGEAIQKWAVAATAAKMPSAELAAGLAHLKAVGEQIKQDEITTMLQKSGEIVTELTGSASDKYRAQAEAKRRELESTRDRMSKDGTGEQFLSAVQSLDAFDIAVSHVQSSLDALAVTEANLSKIHHDLTDNIAASDSDLNDSLIALAEQYNSLDAVVANESANAPGHKERVQQLAAVYKELSDIVGVLTGRSEKYNAAQQSDKDLANERLRKQLGWLQAIAQVSQTLEQAGAMDKQTAGVIQGTSETAQGVTKLIASGGMDPMAWAQTIQGMADLGKALFGESEAHKASRLLLEQNNIALYHLGDQLHAGAVNATAADINKAQSQLGSLTSHTTGSTDSMKTGMKELFATLGLDPTFLNDVAKRLGVTIDGTLGSYRSLAEAVDLAAGRISHFGVSFGELTTEYDAYAKIFNVTDPVELLNLHAKAALSDPTKGGSQTVTDMFKGVDTSSAEGQAALKKRIQDTYTQMMNGGAGVDMGGMTRPEFIQLLETLSSDIDGLSGAVNANTRAIYGVPAGLHVSLEEYRAAAQWTATPPSGGTGTTGTGGTTSGTSGTSGTGGTTSGSNGGTTSGTGTGSGTAITVNLVLDNKVVAKSVLQTYEAASARVNGATTEWSSITSGAL